MRLLALEGFSTSTDQHQASRLIYNLIPKPLRRQENSRGSFTDSPSTSHSRKRGIADQEGQKMMPKAFSSIMTRPVMTPQAGGKAEWPS